MRENRTYGSVVGPTQKWVGLPDCGILATSAVCEGVGVTALGDANMRLRRSKKSRNTERSVSCGDQLGSGLLLAHLWCLSFRVLLRGMSLDMLKHLMKPVTALREQLDYGVCSLVFTVIDSLANARLPIFVVSFCFFDGDFQLFHIQRLGSCYYLFLLLSQNGS